MLYSDKAIVLCGKRKGSSKTIRRRKGFFIEVLALPKLQFLEILLEDESLNLPILTDINIGKNCKHVIRVNGKMHYSQLQTEAKRNFDKIIDSVRNLGDFYERFQKYERFGRSINNYLSRVKQVPNFSDLVSDNNTYGEIIARTLEGMKVHKTARRNEAIFSEVFGEFFSRASKRGQRWQI